MTQNLALIFLTKVGKKTVHAYLKLENENLVDKYFLERILSEQVIRLLRQDEKSKIMNKKIFTFLMRLLTSRTERAVCCQVAKLSPPISGLFLAQPPWLPVKDR